MIHTPKSPLFRGDFKPPLYQEGPGAILFGTVFDGVNINESSPHHHYIQ